MAMQTCPTSVISASADRIWALLKQPEKVAGWSGTELIDGPSPLVPAPGATRSCKTDALCCGPWGRCLTSEGSVAAVSSRKVCG